MQNVYDTVNSKLFLATVKGINYAIKVVQTHKLDHLDEEVEFSYIMGSKKIGPIIYDAFYIKHRGSYTQYIIMEKLFPFTTITESIVKGMIDIYKESLNYVYCTDIKPDNFVLDSNNKVRMIDFGVWCSLTKPNDLNSFMMLSYILLFIMTYIKYDKENHEALTPFSKIKGFAKFVKNDFSVKHISFANDEINNGQSMILRNYFCRILELDEESEHLEEVVYTMKSKILKILDSFKDSSKQYSSKHRSKKQRRLEH
jgi:hypothetical protein